MKMTNSNVEKKKKTNSKVAKKTNSKNAKKTNSKVVKKTSSKVSSSPAYKRKEYIQLLCFLKDNRQKRNKLIDLGDKYDIHAVCDCIHNVAEGNVPLSDEEYKKLKRHKKALRSVVKDRVSLKKRKETLKQHGGALVTFLLPAASSLLQGVATKVIDRMIG